MAEQPKQPRETEPILPWAKSIHRVVHDNQGVPGGTTIMNRSYGGTSYSRIPLFPLGNIRSSAVQTIISISSTVADILTLDTSVFIETVGAIDTSSNDRLTLGRKFSRYLVWGKASFGPRPGSSTLGGVNVNLGVFQGAAATLIQGTRGSDDVARTTFGSETILSKGHVSTFTVVQPSTDDEQIIRLGAWLTESQFLTSVVTVNETVSLMALEIP